MFANVRKSLGLAGAPLPGSVSPHLFLGKNNNSRSKEGLDKLVTEELIDSYDSVTSHTASSTQNKVWCSQGTARWHSSRGAHPASRSRNRGITMHCAIDQAILDSTGPGIPASQNVVKTKSILVASDSCTPETNSCSTQKGSAFSHAYILDKSTSSDVTALSDSQESYAPRLAHSHKSAFCDTAKEAAFSDVAAFSDAQKRCATQHPHSHNESTFSDTAKKSACSDAQKRCAPRQAHSLDKSVFSDTAKKTAFSDAQKLGAPRHAQSHNRSAFSDT